MAKHFKTPEGDAGRESTGRFEPLPAQATAPHRRSRDDEADVTASGPAAGGDHQRRGDLGLRDLLHGAGGALPQRLQVFYGVLELLPRTDATVTYTVTTAAAAGDQPLTVRTTPTCQVAR